MHVAYLPSSLWLSMIVSVGKRKAMTKDSLTAAVTRVPGEYESEAEALQAAKRYIDAEEGGQFAEAADYLQSEQPLFSQSPRDCVTSERSPAEVARRVPEQPRPPD
jgi:hypothetical protein